MTAGWDHEPLLVFALCIPLPLKTDKQEQNSCPPPFLHDYFLFNEHMKKKEGISPVPSVFSVFIPQLPPFPCNDAHISDQGNDRSLSRRMGLVSDAIPRTSLEVL